MREVLAVLAESDGEMDLSALLERCGPSARGSIQRMASLGLLSLGRSEKAEPPVAELGGASRQPLALNGAQSAAIDAIFSREPAVWLLHGVTGSGKTEVYLRCAARVIEEGRQVLVLVPEIALTPQLLGRFRARFGDTVAVLHSGLTGPERLASWRRIHAGERMVALGARSALFAPFRRLGLIVVDEEHDESYKQDEGVRYHARDLAVVRGRGAGCPVILGSATPSIESLRNASEGRYQLLSLPERATPCAPARIEIIDMSHEPRGAEGLPPLLSGALRAALRETLDAGAKAIVLYNRRGFATTVSCKACGGSYICPSCGISLVLHKSLGRVTCHYCGFSVPFSPTCPKCGSPEIELLGQGSERVAEHLCEAFPEVPVLRMDADTTGERGAHARILEDFRSRETGILVGTQLVAKGHDFPDVLLAAVVGVDHLLSLPDFRAAERTWALVTQLAGRAGRGDRAGRVLLQTHHPDHFVFRSLGDAPAFLAEETRHRGILAYPPFTRLVLIRVEGTDPARVQEAVHALARSLRQDRPPGRVVDVLGPTPAPIARMVGRWRYQVLLRGRRYAPFRAWIEEALPRARAALPHGVRCVVDVDPRDLM
jgi:primosomal protein N' (replication factor Y)